MKAEKKENMVKMRAYKKVMGKNKKLNKINLVVLAAGLLLTVLGMERGRKLSYLDRYVCLFYNGYVRHLRLWISSQAEIISVFLFLIKGLFNG